MGVFGDVAYGLMGLDDPRKKLAEALAHGNTPAAPPPAVPPVAPGALPSMAQGGEGPDQRNAPPVPPPQPAAYTSGPDFTKMYLDLMNRQEGSDAIDRGMGLLFAGLAQPNDRASIVQAMSPATGAGSGAGGMIDELQKTQLMQGKIDSRNQLLQSAPAIARQLSMPIEQVIAAINSGAMDDLIKEHDKNTMLQADPLHKAQTDSAQTEADYHRAQSALEQAKTTLANATLPSDIAKAKGEVDKITAEIQKIQAETGAIPDKRALEQAQTNEANAKTADIPKTPDIKNYEYAKNAFENDPANAGKPFMTLEDWNKSGAGSSGNRTKLFGNTHVQVKRGEDGQVLRNPDGSPQIDVVQLTDNPAVAPVVQPNLQPKITKTETATQTIYKVDTENGPVVVDTVNKNVEEGARQKAAGAAEGKAGADASRAFEATNNVLQQGFATFEQLEKHKGLDGILGANSYLPIPRGTDRADAFALQHQAVSVLYNQAVQSLKGITSRAAITEIAQAAAMQGRLADSSQSPEAYRKAIADAKESIRRIAAINADNAGKERPDWVGNIDINAMPQQAPEKTWKRNPKTNKLELQ